MTTSCAPGTARPRSSSSSRWRSTWPFSFFARGVRTWRARSRRSAWCWSWRRSSAGASRGWLSSSIGSGFRCWPSSAAISGSWRFRPRAITSTGPRRNLRMTRRPRARSSRRAPTRRSSWSPRAAAGSRRRPGRRGSSRGLRQDLGDRFDRSLALVSSVSGGSVGAMLFLASYDQGRLAPVGALEAYPPVVDSVRSSLDDLTWGLVYPDLIWSLVPFLKGVGAGHLFTGPNLTSDRGTALERAWELTDGVKTGTLRRWQEEARAGARPAGHLQRHARRDGQLAVAVVHHRRSERGQPRAARVEPDVSRP